jgi:hypothetical protein
MGKGKAREEFLCLFFAEEELNDVITFCLFFPAAAALKDLS